MDYLSMTFKQPAAKWYEALPLGNGSMGAMSYGRFQNEKIELNLDTLWSGTGKRKENSNREIDWEFLRNNIFDEKYLEAEDYCRENVLGDWTESYLPAGNLKIDVKVPVLTEAGSYKRQLSFKEAIENVEFCQEGKRYQREFFVSMSEPVMALHYHSGKDCSLEMDLSFWSLSSSVWSGARRKNPYNRV